MPTDYPYLVIDHVLWQAVTLAFGAALANPEVVYLEDADPVLRVTTDELVRAALKGRYAVATMYVEHDGQATQYSEEEWAIPRHRVLQTFTALRYQASGEADDAGILGDVINPAQVFGMADAWALRQMLFREEEGLAWAHGDGSLVS